MSAGPAVDPDARKPRLTPPPDRSLVIPALRLPAGAVDTHLHMFGPNSRYAFAPDAKYVSEDATAAMYFALQDRLGLSRAVLVSGGGYAQSFEHLADTLATYPDRLRGVVRLPQDVTDPELTELDRLGVTGARLFSRNVQELGTPLFRRVAELGWNLEFGCDTERLADHADALLGCGLTVVIDHFAHNPAAGGVDAPGHKLLLQLLETGRIWLKLSGPMRITSEEPPYPSVTPVVRDLVRHAPERLVWGSDWPHTQMWDRTMPTDALLVDLLQDWIPDRATLSRIMVRNPEQLYGFPPLEADAAIPNTDRTRDGEGHQL